MILSRSPQERIVIEKYMFRHKGIRPLCRRLGYVPKNTIDIGEI